MTAEESGSGEVNIDSSLDLSDQDGRTNKMGGAINGVIDDLIAATEEARDSEVFREFLEAQSLFHNYSKWNAYLIKMQRPSATRVAGYNKWQTEFDRHVKKGENGIYIRYPQDVPVCPECRKTKNKHEESDCEYDETPPEEWDTKRFYNTGSVFDIEQTEGEPVPSLPTDAKEGEGDTPLKPALEAKETLNVTVEMVEPDEWKRGGNGVCDLATRSIRVLNGERSDAAVFRSLVHEYGHALLHTEGGKAEDENNTAAMELETEAVAYVVGHHFGLDMDDSAFYLASWSNDESDMLKSRLGRISETSEEIIEAIEDTTGED